MDLEQIARVFPRKTNASPTDALAFFGPPTIENIADCIKAGVTEVHISTTFTWDLEKAEDLYYAWQVLGVPVEVGRSQRAGVWRSAKRIWQDRISHPRGGRKGAGRKGGQEGWLN